MTIDEIIDDDVFSHVAAGTNASAWDFADYETGDVDAGEDDIRVHVTYSASGEQEDDMMFWGNRICGEAVAIIDDNGKVSYEEVTAEIAPDEVGGDGDE